MWRVTDRMLEGVAWCIAGSLRTINAEKAIGGQVVTSPAELAAKAVAALRLVLNAVPGSRGVLRELVAVEETFALVPAAAAVSLLPAEVIVRAADQLAILVESDLGAPHAILLAEFREYLISSLYPTQLQSPNASLFENRRGGRGGPGWADTIPEQSL
jgi:hypothetical protein